MSVADPTPKTASVTSTPASTAKPGGGSSEGLEGVVAAKSEICFIDGQAGQLVYRGYDIADLVEHSNFEEVAFLLWDGKLPNKAELAHLRQQLGAASTLPEHVQQLLGTLPAKTQPMDALRTATSALAATDPDLTSNEPIANRRKAVRLTAQLPTLVTAFHRLRNGQQPIAPDPSLTIAGNFLYMMDGKRPHDTLTRVMDAALVLHAEHGMNASTFAARVTAATLADMHAAITAAIAALKGPLHGGANQDVMNLLLSLGEGKDTTAAAAAAEGKAREMLGGGQKLAGFGHRVYRTFDPRAHFLRKMSKQLGEAAGNSKWYEMSEKLIAVVKELKPNINPNVDFFSASTYYTMGIPIDLYTPIFAVARVTGWSAHVMEQHKNNRIIRPTDDYVGPFGRKVEPIETRA